MPLPVVPTYISPAEGVDPLAQMIQKAMLSQQQAPLRQAQQQQVQAQTSRLQQMLAPEIALKRAQTASALARAKSGGTTSPMTGPAAQVASIERLKMMYGTDSPQVQNAQKMMDAQTGRWEALAKSYGKLDVTKLQEARDAQLAAGNISGANEVSAALSKKLSDKTSRDQYEALSGVTDEMGNVDMDTISQFAGPQGKAKLFKEKAMASLFGHVSPEYNAYRNFTFQSKAMTDQLRKALGTSVRNEYVKTMLLPLIDNITKTWGNNPELAKSQWKWANGWLSHYRDKYHMYATQGLPASQINKKVLEDKTLSETPPGMGKAQTGITAKPTNPQYTDENIAHTAKIHGISVAEVRKRLGM